MISTALRRTAAVLALLVLGTLLTGVSGATAQVNPAVSGAGSTWSQNAVNQWLRNVKQFGLQVNFEGVGSSAGRQQFRNGTVDFAVSEIPYGLTDKGVLDQPPDRRYGYMPIVAGGTSFMYNLKIGGKRVTNLRLSGANVAALFTGKITRWNDPAIARDNPGLTLPAIKVVPVVRSDGSGTTAQFSTWLSQQHRGAWDDYCRRAGITSSPCGVTSNYPVIPGSGTTAQSGSLGVSGYVGQDRNVGTITYVEYSYAINTGYPVAKVLNSSGFYVEPTASNVAVALQSAKINGDVNSPNYLTQDLTGVYNSGDKRSYPLSSYSYMIFPTDTGSSFSPQKGKSLATFAQYFLCQGQAQADVLGYSPLPRNLVQAGLTQAKRLPGADPAALAISKCQNPTFGADGSNLLAKNAPQPAGCDRQGATQCATGTGGAKATPTVTKGGGGGTGGTGTGGTGTGATGGTGNTATDGNGTATATATGTGTGTGTGTAATGTGVAGDPSVTAAVDGGIDPETGLAISADGVAADGTSVTGSPISLEAPSGWTTSKTLMLLSVLLLLGVIVGPPLLAQQIRGRSST